MCHSCESAICSRIKVLALNPSSIPFSSTTCPKAVEQVPARRRNRKKLINLFVFNSIFVYKDLSFSVFNILYTKSKVSVKYITKNIISEGNEFFLAATNQITAKTISRMNFRAIPAMLCNV